MEKILSDFGVQPVLLLAQVVNFLVLLFILKKLLYKPILKVLEERKKKIEDGLSNAEKIQKELEETEAKREKVINDAIGEGKKIILEATASANQIIADAHTKAKTDMEIMMEQGAQMMAGEKEKMQQGLREEFSNLLMMAMERVSGKAFNKEAQKKLVDDAVKGL